MERRQTNSQCRYLKKDSRAGYLFKEKNLLRQTDLLKTDTIRDTTVDR